MKIVRGQGPKNARLMVVGEAPGAREEKSGIPFSGPSGELVNKMLDTAGLKRAQVYVTNVVKVRPPGNKIKDLSKVGHSIEEFLPELWREVREVNPCCILALGNTALEALTGKTGIRNYRGSILTTKNLDLPKVVPSIHPASLFDRGNESLNSWKQKPFIQFDFRRAVHQSKFRELILPTRVKQICRDYLSIYRYFEQYSHKSRVAVDVEVTRTIPTVISFAFDPFHGIGIPLLDVMTKDNPKGIPMVEMVNIWKIVTEKLYDEDLEKVGQNFKADSLYFLKPWGFTVRGKISDLMLKFHTKYPEMPKSLQFITSIMTEEPYYKSEGKDYNPKRDSINKLINYCILDSLVTIEAEEKMDSELSEVVIT